MNLMNGILWFAALAAAVAAIVQLSRQSVRLREELEEIRSAKDLPPAGVATSRADARPMFGELYDARPSPFGSLVAWPGVPLAMAAAGLFSAGLIVRRPEQATAHAADSTIARDIAAARMQYDSLAKEVAAMHDSMGKLQQHPAASRETAAPKPAAMRQAKRNTTLAGTQPAAAPAIAPLPSLPKMTP